MFEKVFKLSENKTNVKTEVMAGITTFMTMAYIIALNPNLLTGFGANGQELWNGVFMATCIASAIGMFCMAFLANKPFAMAPGMGLNAFFAYTVVGQMGYSWQVALGAVFLEGILFLILSLTSVREAIFNCIPPALKFGVSGGIGLFITFIGLQSAKLVVDGPTLVGLYPFKAAIANGEFFSTGIGAVLAILGVFITLYPTFRIYFLANKREKILLEMYDTVPENVIMFYQEKIMTESLTNKAESTVEYSKIKKIKQSKNMYLLILNRDLVLMVNKNNFEKGSCEEFEKFIKEKAINAKIKL